MNLGTATVVRGDARRIPLADNSVDLIVTSPPYWALRSYSDGGEHYAGQIGDEPTIAEFVDALLDATRESMRVLKPHGSIFVNLGDKYSRGSRPRNQPDQFRTTDEITFNDEKYVKDTSAENSGIIGKSLMGIPWRYAIRCIDELDLILRAEVIWSKPGGLPESVTDRVRRSHETWFHFTLNQRYFANMDPIREPHAQPDRKRADVFGGKSAEVGVRHAGPTVYTGPTSEKGRLPGSVWTINTEPLKVPDRLGIDHFAAFPTEWPKRIIQGWAPETGVVLDPFGGTGTTAMVAKALGRHGVSLDMSADYCRLAEWRTTDRNQLAKVLGIAKVDAPTEDQMSLFTDGSAA
jgi:DNA modification methylase